MRRLFKRTLVVTSLLFMFGAAPPAARADAFTASLEGFSAPPDPSGRCAPSLTISIPTTGTMNVQL